MFRFSRAILFVIGIVSLIVGKTLLANDWAHGVFFWDIASVFWVITLIVGPQVWFLLRKLKRKEEKDLEIIEVSLVFLCFLCKKVKKTDFV